MVRPAVVRHGIENMNWPDTWGVTWYDPVLDMTYSFSANGCQSTPCDGSDVASQVGPASLSSANRPNAEHLVQFAAGFGPMTFRQ